MEGSESKRNEVANNKNDLLTKIQKRIKKKSKKKIKRKEKKREGLNGIRQCRKNGLPEHRRLRRKGAPGHEGMFLKGLRTQYISRETLNEANEARKNEDINKIIDIGRVFRKGVQKRPFNLNSAPENRESKKILDKNLSMTSEDFNKCSLSAISATETIARPLPLTDATIILHEENFSQVKKQSVTVKKKKLNFDKELIMFSLLYEEKVGSQLLHKLTGNEVLEEAFRELRCRPKRSKFKTDKTVENEFVKAFKFLRQNSEPKIRLTEIFQKDFYHENHVPVTEYQSSNISVGFTKNPIEDYSSDLSAMEICENNPIFTSSFGPEQYGNAQFQNAEFEKTTLNITTPHVQFYRRNMF